MSHNYKVYNVINFFTAGLESRSGMVNQVVDMLDIMGVKVSHILTSQGRKWKLYKYFHLLQILTWTRTLYTPEFPPS